MTRGIASIAAVALLIAGCGGTGAPTASDHGDRPTQATASVSATSSPSPSPSSPAPEAWSLVAIGDSIPFNSTEDCPGCKGFIDQYATAITAKTGRTVRVQNLSEHNGLQIDGLVRELASAQIRRTALAAADVIVVSIGFNDIAWIRLDDTCDGPAPDTEPMDWTKYSASCGASSAAAFRPKLEKAFADIVALRAGKPTIFRAINRYNDAIGARWSVGKGDTVKSSRAVVEAWNAMVCKAAQASGFVCADVYHAFNGADGTTAPTDLVVADETHPSQKGNDVIADVLSRLGYAPLFP